MPNDGASGKRPDILGILLAVAGLVVGLLTWFYPDDPTVKNWFLVIGGVMLLTGAVWWLRGRIRSRRTAPVIHGRGVAISGSGQVRGTGVATKANPDWIARDSADPVLQQFYPGTRGVLLSLHPGAIGDVIPPGRYYCRISDGTAWWDSQGKDVDAPGQPLVQVAFPGDFVNAPELPIHDGTYTAIWSWMHGSIKRTLVTREFRLPLAD